MTGALLVAHTTYHIVGNLMSRLILTFKVKLHINTVNPPLPKLRYFYNKNTINVRWYPLAVDLTIYTSVQSNRNSDARFQY